MCIFCFFMKKPAGIGVSTRECLTSSRRSCQWEKLTSHCKGVNYALKFYATDDIITEPNQDIISCKQTNALNIMEYLQLLWTKALRCGPEYDDYRRNATFIGGLRWSIRQAMRS